MRFSLLNGDMSRRMGISKPPAPLCMMEPEKRTCIKAFTKEDLQNRHKYDISARQRVLLKQWPSL